MIAPGDRVPKSGCSAGFAEERESWKADEHMQMEEGRVRIDSIDPVGHERTGTVPVSPGIRAPGTSPDVGKGWRVKRICAGCVP